MQLYLLVKRPFGEPAVDRGIFTTLEKAKSHDPILKGTWENQDGAPLGTLVSHKTHLTYKHTIHIVPANEELHL